VYVLAVADPQGRQLAVPANWASFAEFHSFCATRPDVAYRAFEVAS
jgi:hypothetical protein